MLDVLVAGAGPAGAIAARQLALCGARVVLVDRDEFPREKLCGDTLNPGALQLLASLGLRGGALDHALPLVGMRVTGPGASVEARYGPGRHGLSVSRRMLDQWLLEQAIAAGVRFEPGLTVHGTLSEERAGRPTVRGLVVRNGSGKVMRLPALVTIGADGRRSAVARSVGLGTHPSTSRRWAFGTYFGPKGSKGTEGSLGAVGEMHVRPGWYCGVAPMPGGSANVCVVTDRREGAADPLGLIRRYLASDRELGRRFAGAEPVAPVTVLGPLAVDVSSAGVAGLFLAGDAAGFVDPITGDGLHLAMQGAVLAASETLEVLNTGDWNGAVERLNGKRDALFGGKLRFNRMLRTLTSSPLAVRLAGLGALAAPGVVRRVIIRAGDAA